MLLGVIKPSYLGKNIAIKFCETGKCQPVGDPANLALVSRVLVRPNTFDEVFAALHLEIARVGGSTKHKQHELFVKMTLGEGGEEGGE